MEKEYAESIERTGALIASFAEFTNLAIKKHGLRPEELMCTGITFAALVAIAMFDPEHGEIDRFIKASVEAFEEETNLIKEEFETVRYFFGK